MKCPMETQETMELLLAYCAGKLDPDRMITLERHVAVCAACQEFERKQHAVWDAMDAWEPMPVSADFNRRLYQRIDAEGQTSWWTRLTRPLRPAFGPGLLSRGVPMAATLCLLLVAGVILERPGNLVVPEDRGLADIVQPGDVERTLDDMDMLHTIRVTAADSGTVNSM